MQAGRRYSLGQTLRWGLRFIIIFVIFDSIPVLLYQLAGLHWLSIPWQPISLIGIAVSFYLGFKNNSSYERLWEARKIWGGMVNTSRSFTAMACNFINNHGTSQEQTQQQLQAIKKRLVHRHVAWLHTLSIELRKPKDWEHHGKRDEAFRAMQGTTYSEAQLQKLKAYLSEADYAYIMSKKNKAAHLLSLQTKDLMQLRTDGPLEHFRHLELQQQITEMYTLQGKAERIKNFPFPRQYATVNHFFAVLLLILLPFGMLNVFTGLQPNWLIWLSIPFTIIVSWVFWTMEMIGDYSENPFEGLYNDVPIVAMATDIEIDIRQMLDETDLPSSYQPEGKFKMLL